MVFKGSRKKVCYLMDSPLRGVGVRGCPLKKKKSFNVFFLLVIVLLATKPRAGGLKALVDCSLKKCFFAASLTGFKTYVSK